MDARRIPSVPRSALYVLIGLASLLFHPAAGVGAGVAGPALTAEARERLAEAATHPALAPWQREVMLRVSGADSTPRAETADCAPAIPEDWASSSSVDGEWEPVVLDRYGHAAVYDPVRDRMLVFAGTPGAATYLNDVWALSLGDSPAWTRLAPSGTPPHPRTGLSAIYDPVRDRVICFGGAYNLDPWSGGAHFLNDVWALSLSGTPAWAQLTPSGTLPQARAGHSAIYDPVRDCMIVFGGRLDVGSLHALNDVWELRLSGDPAWVAGTPSGAPTETLPAFPSARFGHSAVYDPVQDRMIVFGGEGAYAVNENDVWGLALGDVPAWGRLDPAGTPPGRREGHSAIFDAAHRSMVVFGGMTGANPSAEVWTLSLAGDPVWTPGIPLADPPPGRSDHSAIFDPVRGRMIVFGGYFDDFPSSVHDDVWALGLAGPATWTRWEPGNSPPTPRVSASVAYDPLRDRMVVFGGDDGLGHRNEVWTFTLSGAPIWTRSTPAGAGPAGGSTRAVYDAARDRLVVIGGSDRAVWALPLAGTPTWTRLTPTGTSPDGLPGTSILDPLRDRIVVFTNSYGLHSNGVWALSLADTPAWSLLSPAGTPPQTRDLPSAIYDPARDRMLIFGGYYRHQDYCCGGDGAGPARPAWNGDERFLNDVWQLTLGDAPAWAQLAPTNPSAALPRADHTAIYDPVRDRMVIFGGYAGSLGNDTYALSLSGAPGWAPLAPMGQLPGWREAHGAIYDPLRDRMVVFGGMEDLAFANDVWFLTWGTPVLDVAVDIRPGDDENAVQPGSNGVLPVAILSGPTFDATTVDPRSVTLAGAGARDRGNGTPMAYREDVNGDGRADLVLHVVCEELRLSPADTLARLTGNAPGNVTVRGADRVRIVGAGARPPKPQATVLGAEGVAAPALLAVRAQPGGGLRVSLALLPDRPAVLDLLDVTGRRVTSQALAGGGLGPREVPLGGGGITPGVYWVRLRQAGLAFTRKAVVLR